MTIHIAAGEMLTACGSLESTWQALLSLQQPTLHSRPGHKAYPLAIMPWRNEPLGSDERLTALLHDLYATMPSLPADTPLILATTKGAIDEITGDGLPYKGQVWQLCSRIQQDLQLQGESLCISAACASGTLAIMQAARRIAAGLCEHVLVVGLDILSDFVINGFASLKALSPTCCRPFDKDRNGLALGEGAAWILLSASSSSFNQSHDHYSLAGWGMSCDATHITAPCRNGSGLLRALAPFSDRRLKIGGINAHGTGTLYNDAMELTAFTSFFDLIPPLASVKGCIGHCLGASGVIEALLCLQSLQHSIVPPTAGLVTPEERAAGSISGTTCLPLKSPSILSCNSGFGGINGALLFESIQA